MVAFLDEETNNELLSDLLWAMIGLNWYAKDKTAADRKRFRVPVRKVPRDFALLRLIAEPVGLEVTRQENSTGLGTTPETWRVSRTSTHTTAPLSMPFQILGRSSPNDLDAFDEIIDLAARRLWAKGLTPFGWANRRRRQTRYRAGSRTDPVRLLASCLFPLSSYSLTRLANRALAQPVRES